MLFQNDKVGSSAIYHNYEKSIYNSLFKCSFIEQNTTFMLTLKTIDMNSENEKSCSIIELRS